MKKKTTLNIVMIGMLILNLFIFTSRMNFLSWYIEDGWGHSGLFLTSFVFFIVFFKSYQLHKNGEITILQKFIPLVSAILSLFVLLMYSSDFFTIFALIVNVSILIIYLISFLENPNFKKKNIDKKELFNLTTLFYLCKCTSKTKQH